MSFSTLALAAVLPVPLRQPALWARLAVVVAGGLLAIALARLAWLLLAGPTLPLDAVAPPAPVQVRADDRASTPIAQWHLFGNAAPLLAGPAIAAPETALRLFLRGTLNESGADEGIAIIADAEGGERAYRVGDALPGGAELTAVQAGRVLLSRSGVTEQLSLPVDTTPGASDGRAPTPAAARRGPGAGSGLSFINPVISTGGPRIDAATRAALPNLEALASQVNVLPVIENGRFAGVRLAVGRDSDLLTRTGLKPTDIVTAVNGIPLDGPQRQQQLLDSLRGSSSVQVTVRRDGKEQKLTVGLQ